MMKRMWMVAGLLCLAGAARAKVVEKVDVGRVWAGHPVGFALLTEGKRQYVGYYDDQRRMTVASRELPSGEWTKQVLPTSVGWDSHNYIAMVVDDAGQLHVAGKMHAAPLIYFRTTRAGDVTSLVRMEKMVGSEESKCTYPKFFRGPGRELIFTYRSGRSGDGNQIYNVYDEKTQTWKRLLDKPLTDGEGKRNAYFVGPTQGPDGMWRLVWVWRESPDCSTNHALSYAQSRDLVHWTKADGTPLPLPMTLENCEVVDPVPVHGGMINGNTVIGFDEQKRVVIGYHKFDAAGNTQVYNARFEDGKWVIHQTSQWDYRWDPSGRGSMPFEIGLGPVQYREGKLVQGYRHVKYGSGTWVLNPETLKAEGTTTVAGKPAEDLGPVESAFAGMQVRTAGDAGRGDEKGVRYELRWETLGVNQDHARTGEAPGASMLRVVKIGN